MPAKQKPLDIGEKVMAKWPGSAKYYEATVISLAAAKSKHLCTVMFVDSDGMEADLKSGEVYRPEYFTKRSRSASPARGRSPGRRRRSRSRSPARRQSRSRSPTRSSPARKAGSAGAKKEPKAKPETPTTATRTSPRKRVKPPAEPKPVEPVAAETPTRVTRSVTRKLVVEEKEALLSTETESRKHKPARAYEFGGPVGATLMILGLPLLILAFYIYCNGNSCSLAALKRRPRLPSAKEFFDLKCCLIYGTYLLFLTLLYLLPVGKVVYGHPLADGSRLDYRVNSFFSLVVTLAGFAALVYFKYPVTILYHKFLAFAMTSLVFSALASIALYIRARRSITGLASNTGCIPYDFFMGHELNPRIGKLDFKFFCEMRPGLIGWVLVNLCMAVKEYEKHGQVSPAMVLVCTFQLLYVVDALWFEASILSTVDILHEGFGYMLVLGDLAFVPFMYSLQARFLVTHRVHLSWPAMAGIVMSFVVGYVIFRGSNSQKDKFRNNPYDPLFQDKETVLTPSGKKLLASGWWGLVRHPNYLGDILMAISWTLPCGFTHLIPWFYPIYLTTLLVHREFRDEAHCRGKYGKSWDEYCRRVPYRIFPKIF